MKRVGKVINIKKNKVYIVTKNDEFCILRRNETTPQMDSMYAGEEYKRSSIIFRTLLVILLSALILLVLKWYKTSGTKNEFIVDMGGKYKITTNASNSVIKVEANNSKAKKVLLTKDIKGKQLDDALYNLIKDSLFEKQIEPFNYITFYVLKGTKEDILHLTEFNKHRRENNIKININVGGDGLIE